MLTFLSKFNSYFIRRDKSNGVDWILFASIIPLLGAGLITMYAFTGNNQFFVHQIIWILVSFLAFFVLSELDFRFLRSTWVSVTLFSLSSIALVALFLVGKVSHGAGSWFSFGAFSLEPADPAKARPRHPLGKIFLPQAYRDQKCSPYTRLRFLYPYHICPCPGPA